MVLIFKNILLLEDGGHCVNLKIVAQTGYNASFSPKEYHSGWQHQCHHHSSHLLSTDYVPGAVLSASHVLTHVILMGSP